MRRGFLRQVSAALAANPFGERRARLDRHLAGAEATGDELPRALHRIEAELRTLGPDPLQRVRPEDASLVQDAILFAEFHRVAPLLDAHIEAQLRSGSTLVDASFGKDTVARLRGQGFANERALLLFGLFYQLRRAWWFIGRGLLGQTSSMRRLRESLWNSLFTHDIRRYESHLVGAMEDFSTILLGETGSGKGAAAAALGRSGFIAWDESRQRFAQSFTELFVSLNLSAFPETLIESELFGHRKGAFTGALEHRDGVFGRCPPHGTIFLDEIGEVPPRIQIKLLSVLQDRVFTPLGARDPVRFSGRVLAATHRDLDALRSSADFRDDFYYRLCSNIIRVPALRERFAEDRGELPRLVEALLGRILGHPAEALAREVAAVISAERGTDDPWPGNVRELEQCIRHVLLAGHASPPSSVRTPSPTATPAVDVQTLIAGHCAALYREHGTYEAVARITGLDRRTVKKYVARR